MQGHTIKKVILCLSEHPFHLNKIKWEGLYVALSQVRLKDDIRLLLRIRDRSTMEYIMDLKKNRLVKCFFKGYTATSSEENETNGLTITKWNSKKASKEAGFI
jgi:hypothetical protein